MKRDFFKQQTIPIIGALLFVVGLGLFFVQRDQLVPFNTTTIYYRAPQADQAWLVWGVNGWRRVPNALRPEGTEIRDGAMRSPMRREGDTFAIELVLQGANHVDFGVSVDYAGASQPINVWDSAGGRNYRISTPRSDAFTLVPSTVPDSLRIADANTAVQQITYRAPEASAVTLIWGINGWNVHPEAASLPNTAVNDGLMVTQMRNEGDAFRAVLPLSVGTELNYLFEVASGDEERRIDANVDAENYSTTVALNVPIVIESVLDHDSDTTASPSPQSQHGAIALGALAAFVGLGLGWLALAQRSATQRGQTVPMLSPFSAKRYWSTVLGVLVSTAFILVVYYRSFDFYRRYNREWDAMPSIKFLYLQFDVMEDGVFVSWLMATLFCITTFTAILCYLIERRAARSPARLSRIGWLAVALLSAVLSLPAFIPTTAQAWLSDTLNNGRLTPPSPQLVALAVLLVVVAGLIPLLLRLVKTDLLSATLLAGGLALALVALFVPVVAARLSFNLLTLPLPALVLLDSGLLLSAGCWLVATFGYGYRLSETLVGRSFGALLQLDRRLVPAGAFLLLNLIGVRLFFQRPLITDPVLARGWVFIWLGSALAALALLLRTQTQGKDSLLRNLYGFFAGVSLMLSLYLSALEAAWYARITTQLLNTTLLFQIALPLSLLFLFFAWFIFVNPWSMRLLLVASLPLVVAALFDTLPAAPALRYFGTALLLLALLAQLTFWQPRTLA